MKKSRKIRVVFEKSINREKQFLAELNVNCYFKGDIDGIVVNKNHKLIFMEIKHLKPHKNGLFIIKKGQLLTLKEIAKHFLTLIVFVRPNGLIYAHRVNGLTNEKISIQYCKRFKNKDEFAKWLENL